MKQAHHVVLQRQLLHKLHGELVLVCRKIGGSEYGPAAALNGRSIGTGTEDIEIIRQRDYKARCGNGRRRTGVFSG